MIVEEICPDSIGISGSLRLLASEVRVITNTVEFDKVMSSTSRWNTFIYGQILASKPSSTELSRRRRSKDDKFCFSSSPGPRVTLFMIYGNSSKLTRYLKVLQFDTSWPHS